jgi:lysophospholipase L1-like esterase
MPPRRILLSLLLLATAALAAAPPATAATTYHEYVALGDSYTSVPGLTWPTTQFVPFGCAQSSNDYPHQVASSLGIANYRDASCGGATADNMTQSQSTYVGTNAPQFDRLTASTDLVTLGIGGNDIGLIGYVQVCENSNPDPASGNCVDTLTAGGVDQVSQSIAAAAPEIGTVLAQIHQRSPNARVFVVNYLDAIPTNGHGCYPTLDIHDVDVAYLSAKYVEMNAMLAQQAASHGATVIDTYSPTVGHDVCSSTNYVSGPSGWPPLHPNPSGANAQSQLVAAAIRRS